MYLLRNGHEVPEYRVFRGEPGDLPSVMGILSDIRSLSRRGLIQLGLLVLIATANVIRFAALTGRHAPERIKAGS